MSRITKQNARSITSLIVNSALEHDQNVMTLREHALFIEAIDALWCGFNHLKVRIEADGVFERVQSRTFATVTGKVMLTGLEQLAIPHKYGSSYAAHTVPSALAEKIAEFAFDKRALSERRDAERAVVTATVLGFVTFKKLKEFWPEAWPFAEAYEPKPVEGTAVLNLTDLNSRLGLAKAAEV